MENNRNLNELKGRTFKHFKGDLYLLIDIAKHTESAVQLVIYKALYDECLMYARPIDMFLEKVDKIKYPNVSQEFRLELVNVESVVK